MSVCGVCVHTRKAEYVAIRVHIRNPGCVAYVFTLESKETPGVLPHHYPPSCLEPGSRWTGNSPFWLGQLISKLKNPAVSITVLFWGYSHAWLCLTFTSCKGLKLRSFCLHSKHSLHWASSPAPSFILFIHLFLRQAPGILLSLSPQSWVYRHVLSCLTSYESTGMSLSGLHAYVANTLLNDPFPKTRKKTLRF